MLLGGSGFFAGQGEREGSMEDKMEKDFCKAQKGDLYICEHDM